MGWKIRVPKIKDVVNFAVAHSPVGFAGNLALNAIKKEMGKTPGLEDSVAAGNADAAKTEQDKKDMEARRRSFLGLNMTGAFGVVNPINPQRKRLGGY